MPQDGTGGTVRTRDSGQEGGRCQGSVTVVMRVRRMLRDLNAVSAGAALIFEVSQGCVSIAENYS